MSGPVVAGAKLQQGNVAADATGSEHPQLPVLHKLEDEHLRVTVVPSEGGRIASIVSSRSGLEFLLQSTRPDGPMEAGMEAEFADGPCAGIDECLPSVGRCEGDTEGGPVPDHGDFWQLSWRVEPSPEPNALHLAANGFSRPLLFRKQLSLDGPSLHVRYSVQNLGSETTTFLYACHPLFKVEPGDRILLPKSTAALRLHSSRNDRLGLPGALIPWPGAAETEDLSMVLPAETGVGDMLYTGRLQQGWCGLYRGRACQAITLDFDPESLPWMGLWRCYGGWPEPHVTPSRPRQYAVALEPTTAPCGTLRQAQAAGLAVQLAAGASRQWTIRFTVSEPGVSVHQISNPVL